MNSPPPTKIDKKYLQNVMSALEDLLAQVQQQIDGIGSDGGVTIPPLGPLVTEYFSPGGGSAKGQTGTYSLPFTPAVDLIDQLGTMASSVQSELKWLKKTLQDTISGIETTINNFGNAEDINEESVDNLLRFFQAADQDITNPPNGSGSSSSSSSSSGSG